MQIILTIIAGSQKGKKFEFNEPDNFLLGRDNEGSKAHFRLNNDDTQVSRNHFLLEINPPDCFIRDAGSLNGTFIVRPSSKQVYFLTGRMDDKSGGRHQVRGHGECVYRRAQEVEDKGGDQGPE
jgi:serine/threonine-protein kinase